MPSREAQERLVDLLAAHASDAEVLARLQEIERRNLELFGYGVKGFTLCMIETAIEVSNGTVPVADIESLLATGARCSARDPWTCSRRGRDGTAPGRRLPPRPHHQG